MSLCTWPLHQQIVLLPAIDTVGCLQAHYLLQEVQQQAPSDQRLQLVTNLVQNLQLKAVEKSAYQGKCMHDS